jgi:hypothetical protein
MGLDVYVGPLCRYYAGDWKLITQQAAEAEGIEFHVIRQHEPGPDAVTDPSEVRDGVLAWRSALEQAASGALPALDWPESPRADYFTDKPDWDGWWAVWFLAAHDEFPEVRAPTHVPIKFGAMDPVKEPLNRRVDEVYRGKKAGLLSRVIGRSRSSEQAPTQMYPHLHLPEIWLPVEFERPFTALDVVGTEMTFGSVPRLAAELALLNSRTVRGDEGAMEGWRHDGPPEADRTLEAVAKFGLALATEAARYGVDHRLPMKLDY